jgi:omega-hydroxy-beta-dihydromenaquinone-9 sulfotransferase
MLYNAYPFPIAMDYFHLDENALMLKREPLAGSSLINLLRLLLQNHFKIDIQYLPRLVYATTISSLLTPLRTREYLQFETTIRETKIAHHPLFILGHWRSGTTYLHNLLSLDTNFGYYSTFHALLPGLFLGNKGFIKSLVTLSLPEKRPMDDVQMGPELPQEEEYALAAMCPYSVDHGLCFPRNASYYNRFIFMDDVSQKIINEWKASYRYLIQKETFFRNGRRLVLKNPSNTARVKLLLELFPEAKFIHIYRNPYHVYQSMMNLLLSIVPYMCLQTPPEIPEVEQQIIEVYKKMYTKYFKERDEIPAENLIEIRYEDFIEQPLHQLKQIYTKLHLNGFNESEKKFTEYITSQAGFKKQKYLRDEHVKEKIYAQWKFAFDTFHYEQ